MTEKIRFARGDSLIAPHWFSHPPPPPLAHCFEIISTLEQIRVLQKSRSKPQRCCNGRPLYTQVKQHALIANQSMISGVVFHWVNQGPHLLCHPKINQSERVISVSSFCRFNYSLITAVFIFWLDHRQSFSNHWTDHAQESRPNVCLLEKKSFYGLTV